MADEQTHWIDGSPILDAELSCEHCGWEDSSDPEWFHPAWVRRDLTDFHKVEPVTVCGFCYRSLYTSSWLAGLNRPEGDLAREMLAGLNLLRAELKRG